jgi:hypothetical protein
MTEIKIPESGPLSTPLFKPNAGVKQSGVKISKHIALTKDPKENGKAR